MSRIYPRLSVSQLHGLIGYARVELFFLEEFRWALTPVPENKDNGIDGHLQIYTEDLINSGRELAVQIRYGKSYFGANGNPSYFEGDRKHIGLYEHSTKPVILILAHPDGRIYWKRFNFLEIEIVGDKWRTELTQANLLSSDRSRGQLIEIAAPPIDDLAMRVQRREDLQAKVRRSEPIYHFVSAEDVESCSVEGIIELVAAISTTDPLAKKARGHLEIYVDYNPGDEIALYEDETFLHWFRTLEAHRVPWFYFCSTASYDTWLVACLNSTCEAISSTPYVDQNREHGKLRAIPNDALRAFFHDNTMRMTDLIERGILDQKEVIEITMAVHNRLTLL